MRKGTTDSLELDGAYGLLILSLVAKLYWLQPELGLFAPAEAAFRVILRNRITAVLCHLVFGLFIISFVALLFRKRNAQLVIGILLQFVIVPLAYLDLTYARFQGSFISSSQWSLWREGFSALSTLRSYVVSSDLFLLVDLPIAAFCYYLAFSVRALRVTRRKLTLVALVSGLALIGLSLHLWNKCSSPDVLSRPYNRRFTSPIIWLLNGVRHFAAKEHYPLLKTKPASLASASGKMTDRPHIIFIQIESLQAGAVEWRYCDKVVMPFLQSLSAKGCYYPSAVSPRMTGVSFDADIAVLTGFRPPPTSDPYNYCFASPPYFPHLLTNMGYMTVTWDNYLPEFYKGQHNHRLLGMKKYNSLRTWCWSTSLPRLSANCPGDYEFLDVVAKDLLKAQKPVFYHVKTVSSHGPWNNLDEQEEIVRLIGRPFHGSDPVLNGYAAVLNYVDKALINFFNTIGPLIDEGKVLVALYGDHGAGLPLVTIDTPQLPIREAREKCVPLLLIGFGKNIYHTKATLTDVPMTVATHMGLPFNKGDLGGRDLYATTPHPTVVNEAELLLYGYGKLGAPK